MADKKTSTTMPNLNPAPPLGPAKNEYATKPTKTELKLGAPHGGPALTRWRRANAGKRGVRTMKGLRPDSRADEYHGGEQKNYTATELRQMWRGRELGLYTDQDLPTKARNEQGFFITSSVLGRGGRINVNGEKPLTTGQFINFIYQLNPNNGELDGWKQKLYAAGFYEDAVYKAGNGLPGGLDADTKTAWSRAVAESLKAGKSIADLIEDRIPEYEGYLKKLEASGGGPPPLVVDLTNPTTLRAFLNQAAQTLAGRDATDQEVQSFVASYQSQEKEFQTKHHEGAIGGGSTQEQEPAPQAAAEEFIKEKAPVEYGSHRVADVSANFLRLITENSIPTAVVE